MKTSNPADAPVVSGSAIASSKVATEFDTSKE
ncbi:hypothetical protein predicted by Glimmer/Critica [Lactiplantibacillus plantarum]|nr:hypothetical protein predicted by Glimmer/Critica [Lactiplantibacillus plantarum]